MEGGPYNWTKFETGEEPSGRARLILVPERVSAHQPARPSVLWMRGNQTARLELQAVVDVPRLCPHQKPCARDALALRQPDVCLADINKVRRLPGICWSIKECYKAVSACC